MSLGKKLLKHLVDAASRERDKAATQHGRAQQAVVKAEDTVSALQSYQSDRAQVTRDRHQSQTSDRLALGFEAAFAGKLTQAVKAQQNEVHTLREARSITREQLAERQRRVAALEMLQARRMQAQRVKRLRAEQRDNDEFASRKNSFTSAS